MKHNVTRMEKQEKSFSQVRPKSGDGSPLWYAPERDLLHQFTVWMRTALERFDGFERTPEEDERLKQAVKELCAIINDLTEGKMAGKPEAMVAAILAMQKNLEGYDALGAAVLTQILWKFWQFAGDVSLRMEAPFK